MSVCTGFALHFRGACPDGMRAPSNKRVFDPARSH